jgi:hypothetical protein
VAAGGQHDHGGTGAHGAGHVGSGGPTDTPEPLGPPPRAIDFRTNDFAYHQLDGFNTICEDGKEYLLTFDNAWSEVNRSCAISSDDEFATVSSSLKIIGTASDGVLTAGLTPDEATAFLGSIHTDYPDYLGVGKLSLVERDGRQYVRMPFVLRALDRNGYQDGMQRLIWAFRAIGARWKSHVLTPGLASAPSNQVEAVYYLDPKTRLPAYSESLLYDRWSTRAPKPGRSSGSSTSGTESCPA